MESFEWVAGYFRDGFRYFVQKQNLEGGTDCIENAIAFSDPDEAWGAAKLATQTNKTRKYPFVARVRPKREIELDD